MRSAFNKRSPLGGQIGREQWTLKSWIDPAAQRHSFAIFFRDFSMVPKSSGTIHITGIRRLAAPTEAQRTRPYRNDASKANLRPLKSYRPCRPTHSLIMLEPISAQGQLSAFGPPVVPGQVLNFGSNQSRRESPRRLNANTARLIANPGNMIIQGASR